MQNLLITYNRHLCKNCTGAPGEMNICSKMELTEMLKTLYLFSKPIEFDGITRHSCVPEWNMCSIAIWGNISGRGEIDPLRKQLSQNLRQLVLGIMQILHITLVVSSFSTSTRSSLNISLESVA